MNKPGRYATLARVVGESGEKTHTQTLGPAECQTEPATPRDRTPRPSRDRLEPGSTIGQFTIDGVLGAGGMGVVYSATDNTLQRQVAIKLVHSPGTEIRARLQREAQAMAKLRHPNVVRVHQAGTHAGAVYVVMEQIEGGTLRTWLDEEHDWKDIVDVFIQAGRGLEGAHAAGLVHRDFKPDNVLVETSGAVLVTDFGLAAVSGETDDAATTSRHWDSSILQLAITRSGQVMGTPRYMSPEQYRGEPADARGDQFSFCVAMWEALYGHPPFRGDSFAELCDAVLDGELSPPSESKVPARIRRVLERGLARDSSQRFGSMTELLSALGRARNAGRRRLVAAAAAVLIAGGAFTAFAAASDNTSPDQCPAANERLAGVWDSSTRRDVSARIATMSNQEAADNVRRQLDDYATTWIAAHRDTCRATHVRHEQSRAVLDARMQCLSGRLQTMSALAHLLRNADKRLAMRAPAAAAELPAIDDCAAVKSLTGVAPPPARIAVEVTAVRSTLARIDALILAADYDRASDVARKAVARARKLEYAPLVAAALFRLGELHRRRGKYDAAARTLRDATRFADAGGDEALRARALLALAQLLGRRLARHADGHRLLADARAVLQRLDPNQRDRYRADALRTEALIYDEQGKHEQALNQLRRAQKLRADPPESFRGAQLRMAIADALFSLGRNAEAERLMAATIATLRAQLGRKHPEVGRAMLSHANAISMQRRYKEALAIRARARRVLEDSLGPDHPSLATVHQGMGADHKRLKQLAQALEHFRRAVVIKEKAYGKNHVEVGRSVLNVGEMLLWQGHPTQALAPLRRAVDIYEQHDSPHPIDLAMARYRLGQALWNAEGKRKKPRKAQLIESCRYAAKARDGFASTGKQGERGARSITKWMGKECPKLLRSSAANAPPR